VARDVFYLAGTNITIIDNADFLYNAIFAFELKVKEKLKDINIYGLVYIYLNTYEIPYII
jgi:hypothetical protein